jgi:type II secretory pathway pseudopilin PulG
LLGFTILEAIAMVAIVAILVVFTIPNYNTWLAKASQAKCMANMRSVHLALGNYLNDHKDIWPQGPSPLEGKAWAQTPEALRAQQANAAMLKLRRRGEKNR